jgi:hypothetical protein
MGMVGMGLPNINIGTGNGAGFKFGVFDETTPGGAGVPSIRRPGIDTQNGWKGLLGSLASTGFNDYLSYRQADLLESQINKGQVPSIVAGPNGAPSAGFSSTTVYGSDGKPISTSYAAGNTSASTASTTNMLFYVAIAFVLIFLLKR